jgi:transposase
LTSRKKAALILGISESTVEDILRQKNENGGMIQAPRPMGPSPKHSTKNTFQRFANSFCNTISTAQL